MSPGIILGLLIFAGFIVWMVVRTVHYERTKRREGKEAADAELAEEDQQTSTFLEDQGRRTPVLYHVLTGVVFVGAGLWLSANNWQEFDALEDGSVDSVTVVPGTGAIYENFGPIAAKLVMPAITAIYLVIWFVGLAARFKSGRDAGSAD